MCKVIGWKKQRKKGKKRKQSKKYLPPLPLGGGIYQIYDLECLYSLPVFGQFLDGKKLV
jgi:hypothetical protein